MKKCLNCEKEIKKKDNVFCSKSCSAILNNKARKKIKVFDCAHCGKTCECTRSSVNVYCSNECQHLKQMQVKIQTWLKGEHKGWSGKCRQLSLFVRNHLKHTRGSACEICKWDGHHPDDGRSLTEIDHIDGDAENCRPENLKIVCPNCHSMTPTYRARNKNSKRIRNNKKFDGQDK